MRRTAGQNLCERPRDAVKSKLGLVPVHRITVTARCPFVARLMIVDGGVMSLVRDIENTRCLSRGPRGWPQRAACCRRHLPATLQYAKVPFLQYVYSDSRLVAER